MALVARLVVALCATALVLTVQAVEAPIHEPAQSILGTPPRIVVAFSTQTNHTLQLAGCVADGAVKGGAHVRLRNVQDINFYEDVVVWADAVIVGCPVHYGNPDYRMLQWIEDDWSPYWQDVRLSSKVSRAYSRRAPAVFTPPHLIAKAELKKGAVFATGGGISQGIEHTLTSLARALWSFRIQVVTSDPTQSGYASYGAIAITGTSPFNETTPSIDPEFADAAQSLGTRVARAVRAAR
eukprot:scaffold1540_cov359-Prasinococcus_capsulatus_cf.AAC.7